MSSSSPTSPADRGLRRRVLLLLVVALQLVAVSGAAAAPPELVVVARPLGDRLELAVDLPGAGDVPVAPWSFSATVDGAPQPIAAEPVLSDRLVVAAVVDASLAGRPALQAGVSGLTDFALALPRSVRSALVADAAPPDVLAPLQPGPVGALRALTAVRPHGDRRTSTAVDLALRQLPAEVGEPRVVVLHTAAADADGEPAAALAERLNAAGALLAVVTTAGDGRTVPEYWSAVAAATGGVALSAPPSEVVPAFDRLAAALRTRHLLTAPMPEKLPETVVVRVDTAGGSRTAAVVVPAVTTAAGSAGGMSSSLRLPVALAGAVLVLVTGALAVVAAPQARRSADPVRRWRAVEASRGAVHPPGG